MSDGLPPAGWYADPTDAAQQRYWDGTAWTEHVAPAAGGGSSGTATGAASSSTAGGASTGGTSAGSSTSWSSDPLAASSSTVGAAGTGGTVLAAGGGGNVDTWTWQSIVATILCCNILGVVGVLNAGRAEAAQRAGDRASAAKFAADARRWTLWAGGIYLALFALFGVLAFIGAFAELQ